MVYPEEDLESNQSPTAGFSNPVKLNAPSPISTPRTMTFSQYRKAQRRVFSYSDTSSAVFNPDAWHLNEEDAVL